MGNKKPTSKGRTVYQSSITGKYVPKQYAETHKSNTFSHFIKNKPKR